MILVTGSGGQLGSELTTLFSENNKKYRSFSRSDWDITSLAQCERIMKEHSPRIIVNCAAYNQVDNAEDDFENAALINEQGPRNLAKTAFANGAFLVHISSDFVFGDKFKDVAVHPYTTRDVPAPIGKYAFSKYRGELAVKEEVHAAERIEWLEAIVIRTSWVYAAGKKNFPATMLKLAEEKDFISVVEDQIGRPTFAKRLAEFVLLLIEKKNILAEENIPGGLYHFSNSGVASWYDFACETIDLAFSAGLIKKKTPIRAIRTEEFPTRAKRPAYSVLDLTSARSVMPDIPHWKDDLKIFIEEIKSGKKEVK